MMVARRQTRGEDLRRRTLRLGSSAGLAGGLISSLEKGDLCSSPQSRLATSRRGCATAGPPHLPCWCSRASSSEEDRSKSKGTRRFFAKKIRIDVWACQFQGRVYQNPQKSKQKLHLQRWGEGVEPCTLCTLPCSCERASNSAKCKPGRVHKVHG